jgi:hypothetical protein
MTTWAQLTPTQRTYLRAACDRGLIPTSALDMGAVGGLRDDGLVHQTTSQKGGTRWKATDSGRGLVASRGLVPCWPHLYSQYGYAHSHDQAMRHEPESMGGAA